MSGSTYRALGNEEVKMMRNEVLGVSSAAEGKTLCVWTEFWCLYCGEILVTLSWLHSRGISTLILGHPREGQAINRRSESTSSILVPTLDQTKSLK